jgi:hypothetical protein
MNTMKIAFVAMLVSMGVVACGAAPDEGGATSGSESTAVEAAPTPAKAETSHALSSGVMCTPAQQQACWRRFPDGAGCTLRNGVATCIPY